MAGAPTAQERTPAGQRLVAALRTYVDETGLYVQAAGREQGLHPTDMACLGALVAPADGRDEPLTAGRLSALLGLSPAATSALLARLETRGLASRSRSPDDARQVVLSATPRGADVLWAAIAPLSARMTALLVTRDDLQLETVAGFLSEATQVSRQARRALRDGGG